MSISDCGAILIGKQKNQNTLSLREKKIAWLKSALRMETIESTQGDHSVINTVYVRMFLIVSFKGINRPMEIVYFWNTPLPLSSYHYDEIKSFILSSLTTYKIDSNNVRMSFIRYPTAANQISSTFKYFDDLEQIKEHIKELKQQNDGATVVNLNKVIQKSFKDLNLVAGGGQGSSPKVFVFFIRESDQEDLDLQLFEENLSELKSRNILPVIVYFGRKDLRDLKRIIGNPDQVIQVGDWDSIFNGIGLLERQIGKSGGNLYV